MNDDSLTAQLTALAEQVRPAAVPLTQIDARASISRTRRRGFGAAALVVAAMAAVAVVPRFSAAPDIMAEDSKVADSRVMPTSYGDFLECTGSVKTREFEQFIPLPTAPTSKQAAESWVIGPVRREAEFSSSEWWTAFASRPSGPVDSLVVTRRSNDGQSWFVSEVAACGGSDFPGSAASRS